MQVPGEHLRTSAKHFRLSIGRKVFIVVVVLIAAVIGGLVLSKPDVNIDRMFRQARIMVETGNVKDSVPLLDEILSHAPNHAKALLYRGQVAAEQGDPDAAIGFFERVGDDDPREAGTARYLAASAWYKKQNARRAEQQFLASISLHPTFLKPRESLARLYYIQIRPAEMQQQLEAIRKIRDWNLEELFASQLAWFTSSLPLENLRILEGFVAADPADVVSCIALARHYLTHDRTGDAIELLQKALLSEPKNLTVHGLLSECHLKLSDTETAWRQFEHDTPAADNTAAWWRGLGRCATEAELWPEAVNALTRAVADNPNDFEAAYLLGIAAKRCGQVQLAEQQLEIARKTQKMATAASVFLVTDRDRQEILSTTMLDVGRSLVELHRPQEALPWLSAFLTIRQRHQEAESLWRLADSQAGDSQPLFLADVDPGIVTKIGIGIRRKAPLESVSKPPADTVEIRLRDIHSDVGLDFQFFNGESEKKSLLQTVGGGVAVLDYDGDDWPDLFFPNGKDLEGVDRTSLTYSDQLYRNTGGGVKNVTHPAGVLSSEFGQGSVACDYNNDGFQDLCVGTFGRVLVYRNEGDGTFTEVAEQSGITGQHWTSSLAISDLDLDGDLDLFISTYVKDPLSVTCRDNDGRPAVCSPANFQAEEDVLYASNGDETFKDVTQAAGIEAPNGKGLGVVIADFSNDGWPDIYVANDGEPNFLFQNQTQSNGGSLSFCESGLASGAAVSADGRAQAGMGIACDDFDHDGWLDLYVTNFYQDYNTFYQNQANLTFVDQTSALRLVNPTMKTLGFGTQSVDLDLDGNGEIIVANGHIYDRRFEGIPWQMPPHCFRRLKDGTYQDIAGEIGPYFRGEYIGRGVARLDFNHDYLPDAVVVHHDRPVALLVNETQKTGRAVVLKLRGIQSNRDAIGARIEFRIGDTDRMIEVTGGDGFCASNERTMIIGVGQTMTVPAITVRWPSGHIDKLVDVPTNTNLVLVESRLPVVLPMHAQR
jgi:tetratricopeptide (TPR) repeat protein